MSSLNMFSYNGIYDKTCNKLYNESYKKPYDKSYNKPCDEPHNNNNAQEPTNITYLNEFENDKSLSSTKTAVTNKQYTDAKIAKAMETCLRLLRIIFKIIVIICNNTTFNDKFLQDFADSISSTSIQFDYKQQSI
ncbi:5106_t:CDS:2 [Cetraspora pellucida]|uniref:5106_t:CDS:1 n=1 Tax=Cetraspora pellucida TaxID=1433469 RepID=A0A9N9APB9_9GLOM|nr:5106_t:CDS:2 [Cetraspora pellucida]